MLYILLKYLHILAAIAALGTNLTYLLWINRAKNKPEVLVFTLHTIKIIDDRIATPAYVLLFPSGWWLAALAGWSMTTPWILTALLMYGALSVIGLGIYTPTLSKQIAIAENPGTGTLEYKKISSRSNAISGTLIILVMMILYLMVAKPTLWSQAVNP